MMNDDTNKGFSREVRTFIYNRTPNIFVDLLLRLLICMIRALAMSK